MKNKGRCVVSAHVAAPCEGCGKPADPCHIIMRDKRDIGTPAAAWTSVTEAIKLYCEACCPEHGAPLLASAAEAKR